MARAKKVTIERPSRTTTSTSGDDQSFFQRIQDQLESNQSYLSLVLGLLIVFVIGILVFNYFKQAEPSLGPSQNTQEETAQNPSGDVSPDNLPGNYTVKEGDTLFLIAENYYQDGFKYSEIVEANNLPNENSIEVGQVLNIPKLEEAVAQAATPTPESETTVEPTNTPMPTQAVAGTTSTTTGTGTGGSENATIWGDKIDGTSYTVQEGDWLSKIAGRAYGDIMQYEKIAQANNITNPDVITPGTVIQLPR